MIENVKKINNLGEFACYKITYPNTIRVTYAPHDEANTDYQNILQWVADGNTIQEAD